MSFHQPVEKGPDKLLPDSLYRHMITLLRSHGYLETEGAFLALKDAPPYERQQMSEQERFEAWWKTQTAAWPELSAEDGAKFAAWNGWLARSEYVGERQLMEAALPYLEEGHMHIKVMDHGMDVSQPCERCEVAKRIRQFISSRQGEK